MDKSVLLVQPIVCETKSKLGIILPSKVRMYQEGIVKKIGELEQDIKVGDKIMYANNIQTEIDYENEKCHLIDEVYVLAILLEPKQQNGELDVNDKVVIVATSSELHQNIISTLNENGISDIIPLSDFFDGK